jgi:hypothetical protein
MNKIVGMYHFMEYKDNKNLLYANWSVIVANRVRQGNLTSTFPQNRT